VLAVRSVRRAAFAAGPPVLDVRPVCTRAGDYSRASPIEPSHLGGALPRSVADYCFGPEEEMEGRP
jgi:hypothetical protein